nr:MAG TPA: hypothetical protein [Caudoviricetes sp.]
MISVNNDKWTYNITRMINAKKCLTLAFGMRKE